jgi:hypothetical protein
MKRTPHPTFVILREAEDLLLGLRLQQLEEAFHTMIEPRLSRGSLRWGCFP